MSTLLAKLNIQSRGLDIGLVFLRLCTHRPSLSLSLSLHKNSKKDIGLYQAWSITHMFGVIEAKGGAEEGRYEVLNFGYTPPQENKGTALLLVFSLTSLKIDRNKNQNRSTN